MDYVVVTPAWDTEGKFFVIDAAKKQDIIIAENNAATYAEALPEMASDILSLYEKYDATEGIKEMGQYIFRPATEDWYLAEVQVR
jgi:outer membrane receptor for monomeric catechols